MSVLLAVGLLVALPAPANAKKPTPPPGPEPVIGLTCAQWAVEHPQFAQTGDADNDFEMTLDADNPVACYDVVVSQAGTWQITIDAESAASLEVQVKDSIPGDFCYRGSFGKKKNPIPDMIDVEIPAAAIDACTPGEVGLAADQDPALVFVVAYSPERGTTGSEVTISIDLP
jgi:hypothetical protein